MKTYTSKIAIFQKGKKKKEGIVKVNIPLWFQGRAFYQQNFVGETGTVLIVVYDLGLALVLSVILLCILGIPYLFYFQLYLRKRKKKKLLEDFTNQKEGSK